LECAEQLRKRRNTMRVFIAACIFSGVIAFGAAVILDNVLQEPASAAFTEPSARI
jgi:hypothetical protein